MMVCTACLAGTACKYSDKINNTDKRVVKLVAERKAVPICLETLGGLPCSRIPSVRKGDKVINKIGENVTEVFDLGAKQALAIIKLIKAKMTILMSRSLYI